MTSQMDIYAETSSCQREERLLIHFVEESMRLLSKVRSHRAKIWRDEADLDSSLAISVCPKAGDILPAQHIPQHGAHLQSPALNPREVVRGWQGFAGGTLPAPGGGWARARYQTRAEPSVRWRYAHCTGAATQAWSFSVEKLPSR